MRKTNLKPISKKRRAQMKTENSVKQEIWEKGNGLCELCEIYPIAGKGHEIIFRSHCGDPTDPFNIIQLCLGCHRQEHGELIPNKYPHRAAFLLELVYNTRVKQGYKEEK